MLVMRWVEVEAGGAWEASRIALEAAIGVVPALDDAGSLQIAVEPLDPDLDRRRPQGA